MVYLNRLIVITVLYKFYLEALFPTFVYRRNDKKSRILISLDLGLKAKLRLCLIGGAQMNKMRKSWNRPAIASAKVEKNSDCLPAGSRQI